MSQIGQSIKNLLYAGRDTKQIASELKIEIAQVNGILWSEYGLGINVYATKPKQKQKRRTREQMALARMEAAANK